MKVFIKHICLLMLFLFQFGIMRAQTPFTNTGKYWWYRYRLVNDFMKIGDQCGESIPAGERYQHHPYLNENPPTKDLSGFDHPEYNGTLHWGDATEHLGNYIMMLATEYRMLVDNNMATDRTLYELYYALGAFDRLDRNAEDYCWDPDGTYPCHPSGIYQDKRGKDPLNGFFIRDDVPIVSYEGVYLDFVQQNFQHFNRPGKTFGVTRVSDGAFAERVKVGGQLQPYHTVWNSSKQRVPQEESQDQLVELYMGTALTTRLVDNWVTYNGKNLAKQAGDAEYRLVKYAAWSYNGLGSVPKFQLNNPVTTLCVYGTSPSNTCNAGGADIIHLGVGATIGLKNSAKGVGSCNNSDINSILAWTGPPYDFAFQLTQFCNSNTCNDMVYPYTYSCFANYWVAPDICGGTFFPPVPPYPCLKNSTQKVIKRNSFEFNDIMYPHLPMVYKIISGPGIGHGTDNISPQIYGGNPSFPTLFNNAPSCGCYNYGDITTNDYGNWYWSSPNWSQDYFKRGAQSNADYNNLDYMYLFDLYNLNDAKYINYYFNSYFKENFGVTYPVGNLGTSSNKIALNFLEYLSLVNKNLSGTNLIYRGAKVVDIKPGFDAQYGSSVTIYVEDYYCSTDNKYYYASINGKEVTNVDTRGGAEPYGKAGEGGDTITALDLVPYEVKQTNNPDYDSTIIDTNEEEDNNESTQNYIDSLLNLVYESGDDYLIQKIKDMDLPHGQGAKPSDTIQNNNVTNKVEEITLYPNPSKGDFTVLFPTNEKYNIYITDIIGTEVFKTIIQGQYKIRIELSNLLSSGSYRIIVISEDRKKTIKQLTLIR